MSLWITSISKPILINTTGHYIPVVLFIKINKVVLTFTALNGTKSLNVTIEMRANEHCFAGGLVFVHIMYIPLYFVSFNADPKKPSLLGTQPSFHSAPPTA